MNSMIFSAISAFCLTFLKFFKASVLYKLVVKISDRVSAWWADSVIMNFLRKEHFEKLSAKSVLQKVVYTPFSIFGAINKRFASYLSDVTENSVILNLSRCFMNNALALNTRFYGCILLGMLITREVISLQFSLLTAGLALIGILFVLTDYNVTDFFAQSSIIRFVTATAGFPHLSWNIYKKEDVKRPAALILAVIAGGVMGLMSLKSLIFALALPVVFVGVCTVMVYPISGVFFAAFAAPFVPTMLLAGLCTLTFCSVLVKSVCEKNFKWKIDGVGTSLGFFLLFMLVSCIFSFSITKSMMVWGMYLIFVGFYFVIINTVKTKEQLYAILKVFVIAGALVSLYGVLQYIFGWNTSNAWIDEEMFEEATMRAYSTMENPNVLGEYLLLVIPLSALFMLRAGGKTFQKWFYLGVFLLSALCMIFTQSRGCWLGLILAAAVFVTFYNGRLWGFLPLVLLILPFVIPETMVDRMMSVGNLEDSSTSYRVFIWLGTFQMLKDFWIGGIGMGEGSFRSVYPLYSYNAIVAPHSHNTFLQLLVEGGIAALVIFVITMALFIKNMASVYRRCGKDSMEAMTALAIGSGVLGFLLQSMFDYTFYNYRMMAMLFMILAFGGLLNYLGNKKGQEL
ncbi:MAG: O-antigen ligase family protein [Clostridia bacterium]|nr:O-antigen ligase family protein [Clostridia bacterium]